MNNKTTQKERDLDVLNAKLLQYIKLLVEELDELVSIAYVHGWYSKRYAAGRKMRKEINRLAKKLGKGAVLYDDEKRK